MFLISYMAGITAIALLWFVYPKNFNYGTATGSSLQFLDAMKVPPTCVPCICPKAPCSCCWQPSGCSADAAAEWGSAGCPGKVKYERQTHTGGARRPASLGGASQRSGAVLQVGTLPANNPVEWRHTSLTYEASSQYNFPDLTGGWLTGGAVGNLKMTQPTGACPAAARLLTRARQLHVARSCAHGLQCKAFLGGGLMQLCQPGSLLRLHSHCWGRIQGWPCHHVRLRPGLMTRLLCAAFATALLAWGLLSFAKGFSQGTSNTAPTLENVQWGADYLLKTFRPGNANGSSPRMATRSSTRCSPPLPPSQQALDALGAARHDCQVAAAACKHTDS